VCKLVKQKPWVMSSAVQGFAMLNAACIWHWSN